MKKMILLGVGLVVILALTVSGTLFFAGAFDPAPEPIGEGAQSEAGVAPPPSRDIFYFNIQPEFVVNFRRKERPRVLMVEMVIASHHEDSLVVLDTHSAELRNNLLLLLTEQDGAEVAKVEGKNKIRELVKQSVNELIEKHVGAYEIKDVFLTRFVLQ